MARPHSTAPDLTSQQVANFWAKVARGGCDDCWPWQGALLLGGYGKFTARLASNPKKPVSFLAHVMARWLATGEWPSGLCTLHTCDNRPCCNPAHLWLGTNAENSADMVRKGRQNTPPMKGEQAGRAKLTEVQVLEIRRLHATGSITLVELGRRFGVHPVSIRLIVKRINWSHLP